MDGVHVCIVKVNSTSPRGGAIPVPMSATFGDGEVLTPDVTTTWSTLEANDDTLGSGDPSHSVWRVAVGSDAADVLVGFVPTGTVITEANGFLCVPGDVYEFGVSALGDVCGVILA